MTPRMVSPILLLSLVGLMMFSHVPHTDAESCAVPKVEQEFCNSFYSVCLSTPNKQCLADSMTNCIGETGFPSTIIESIRQFLVQFLIKITKPIVATTKPPVSPLVTFTRATVSPLRPYSTLLPPLPTIKPTIVILPETEEPATPSTSLPSITFSSSFPFSIVTLPPTTESTTMKSVIAPTSGVVDPVIDVIVNTGSPFLDYIISLLYSLQERRIANALIGFFEISKNNLGINIGVQTNHPADVNLLIFKIDYLLKSYSSYAFEWNDLSVQLKQLFTTNSQLYLWFAMIIDHIFTELGIHIQTDTSVQSKFSWDDYYTNFISNLEQRRIVQGCHADPAPGTCEVYCTNAYGGNWVGVQARERISEAAQTFDRLMEDYGRGFGDWQEGYWMGLECIHAITNDSPHELLIELANAEGQTAIAHYADFSVGDASTGYDLRLGSYLGGAAGDAIRSSVGQMFTTRDHDADDFSGNCAAKHEGGWWYKNCQKMSTKNFLNGYFSSDTERVNSISNFPYFGVRWETWDTTSVVVATRMFIRRSTWSTSDVKQPTTSGRQSTASIWQPSGSIWQASGSIWQPSSSLLQFMQQAEHVEDTEEPLDYYDLLN